jgi:hypothetical protein
MEDARVYLINARRDEELRDAAAERLVHRTKPAKHTRIGSGRVRPGQPKAEPVRPGTAARSSA